MGMRRLGSHCYTMNHAENGFPQLKVHFLEPWSRVAGLMDYLNSIPGMEFQMMTCNENFMQIEGSASGSIENFFHNPYELGWGRMIHFDTTSSAARRARGSLRHRTRARWSRWSGMPTTSPRCL